MKMSKNFGAILLAVWLILYGLISNSILTLNFSHSGDVLAVLAIVTGVILLMQRA